MANIYSAQDGDWNTAATWSGGTVPTSSDDVFIAHTITFAADIAARYVTVQAGGSLYVADAFNFASTPNVGIQLFYLDRVLHDTRRFSLDGCILAPGTIHTTISCRKGTDSFPATPDLNNMQAVIIDDPGFISCSSILRDIKPEGCTPAYAEKVSNAVRYLTATVHIKADKLQYLASLYRMARGPFQVLLVTPSTAIKGYIESVVPDPASVGKEYISVKVTVTEGPGA